MSFLPQCGKLACLRVVCFDIISIFDSIRSIRSSMFRAREIDAISI